VAKGPSHGRIDIASLKNLSHKMPSLCKFITIIKIGNLILSFGIL
jgi:hypothetical protein